jgi:hypothetical protein
MLDITTLHVEFLGQWQSSETRNVQTVEDTGETTEINKLESVTLRCDLVEATTQRPSIISHHHHTINHQHTHDQ